MQNTSANKSATYLDPLAPMEEILRRIEANLTMDREVTQIEQSEQDATQPPPYWGKNTPLEIAERFRKWAQEATLQSDKDNYLRQADYYDAMARRNTS